MNLFQIPQSKFRILIFLYLILAVFFFTFKLGGSWYSTISGLIYLLSLLIGLYSAIYTLKAYGANNPHRRVFSILTTAVLFVLIAQLVQGRVIYIDAVFYLMAYLFFVIGYSLEAIHLKINLTRKPFIFLVFFIVGFALLSTIYHFQFQSPALGNIDPLINFFNLSYLAGDVCLTIISLLIFHIILSYRGGLLSRAWIYIFIAHFAILFSDTLYAVFYIPFTQNIWPYTLISLVWIFSNISISYGFFKIGHSIHTAQDKIKEFRP